MSAWIQQLVADTLPRIPPDKKSSAITADTVIKHDKSGRLNNLQKMLEAPMGIAGIHYQIDDRCNEDLDRFLGLAFTLAFKVFQNKSASLNQIISYTGAKQLVARDLDSIETVILVILENDHLSEHSPKLFDSKVPRVMTKIAPDQALLEQQAPALEQQGFFTSSNSLHSRLDAVTYSGNAKLVRCAKLLTYRYRRAIDSTPFSLFSSLIEGIESPLCQALIRIGVSESKVQTFCDAAHDSWSRQNRPDTDEAAIHYRHKISLVPAGNGNYIGITPVANNGVVARINSTLNSHLYVAANAPHPSIICRPRVLSVGNDIDNGGLLSAQLPRRGVLYTLDSLPPPARYYADTEEKMLARILAIHSVVRISDPARVKKHIRGYKALLNTDYSNVNMRRAADYHLKEIVSALFELANWAADYVAELDKSYWQDTRHPLSFLDDLERRWLDPRLRETSMILREDIQTLTRRYLALLNRYERDLSLGDNLAQTLTLMIEKEVAAL